jgi:DNA segregation ATPase FtsK/SpoIIIE, S-DNA-T family
VKLKVTYRRQGGTASDLVVDVDGSTTVGALADVLQRADPFGAGSSVRSATLAVEGVAQPATVLEPDLSLVEAGLASGQYVSVAAAPTTTTSAAVLSVVGGPDAGKHVELRRGVNTIGRDRTCDVVLTDRMVSKHHAKVIVGETVEIVDDNSSNGILLGGDQVQRVELRSGDTVLVGDTLLTVQLRSGAAGPAAGGGTAFNRSPRVDPRFEGLDLEAPEPPTPQKPQRFPVAMLVMPMLMAAVLFGFISTSASGSDQGAARFMTIIFVAISPLMAVGSWWESRRAAKQDFAEAVELFRQNLAQLVAELRAAQDQERVARAAEHPSTAEVVSAIRDLGPLVWTRRPEHQSFGEVRLGLGTQPSRSRVEVARSRNAPVELQDELHRTVAPFRTVDNVPIVGTLSTSGSFGVSGPDELRRSVLRGLVAQLCGLHSPAELTLGAMAAPQSLSEWDWVKWLPHVAGDHWPLGAHPLATTAPACTALTAELSDLIAERAERSQSSAGPDGGPPLPVIVIVVEDDAPVERSAVVRLMEAGREHGVHVIWSAASTTRLPAAARTFLELDPRSFGAATGKVIEAERVQPVVVEPLDLPGADWLARRLAPVVDAGAVADDGGDVPTRVSFLSEAGAELATSASAVVERWTESNSLRVPGASVRRNKRDNTLRALVGRTAADPLHLDLRTQGPHALVGGTTGAGKSEFLQTWILGMAGAHSPQRVTFLFVDYKGGAAFADCVELPHSVGLVTDLSPHLVQRALLSLNAELRHREHVLNRKQAKDLLELERRGDPECPPSLVIVVDEFAALVQEVPEFVDGVVNVAQRGRSLGLHLILATQRPAGVIKDNLRANTNLRVALRMADEDDSRDVVGTTAAATFDPAIPGRGVVKTGPGRLATFQSGYVGGWTSDVPPPPDVAIATLTIGMAEPWEIPEDPGAAVEEEPGPPDIQRIVGNLRRAAVEAGVEAPRKPWLPELATAYDLAALPLPRRDTELVVGVVDEPDKQEQNTTAFRPDLDGNLAVFGTGGAGKSTFLRTLAVSAGLTRRGGPCFVYGLDFGARGLSMLEQLPHVGAVIGAEDTERTARVLKQLRETIDERGVRYAAVNAGTIEEYRRLAGAPEEPRVLLLIDGFSAFRTAYELGPQSKVLDQLISIAGDGRPVGVHVALSADRLAAVPAALASSIQWKLALRLSNEMDESMLDVPRGGFGEAPPPGRGFLAGAEVQVAVLGRSPDVAGQADEIGKLAESMRRSGALEAPPVRRLPERVQLSELPTGPPTAPVFALADEDLEGVGVEPSGVFLVAGPARSGRTTALTTLVAACRRAGAAREVVHLGPARSQLADQDWQRHAAGEQAVADLVTTLSAEWSEHSPPDGTVLVVEALASFIGTEAEYGIQDLVKVARTNGVFVIVESETADLGSYSELAKLAKTSGAGIVLQPDQTDGDALFKTTFPRMSRAEFPAGRGMLVRGGRFQRVQVAVA